MSILDGKRITCSFHALRTLIPGLTILLACLLGGCACCFLPKDVGEGLGMMLMWAPMNDAVVLGAVAQYHSLHGRWPKDAHELTGSGCKNPGLLSGLELTVVSADKDECVVQIKGEYASVDKPSMKFEHKFKLTKKAGEEKKYHAEYLSGTDTFSDLTGQDIHMGEKTIDINLDLNGIDAVSSSDANGDGISTEKGGS